MPCWQRRVVTVDLNIANYDLLKTGLEAHRFTVREVGERALSVRTPDGRKYFRIENGTIEVEQGDEALINQVKQAYSHAIVRSASRRGNWTVTADRSDENQLTIGRRG